MIGIAALAFILIVGGVAGFFIGYVTGQRSAARKFQRGFPVQPPQSGPFGPKP